MSLTTMAIASALVASVATTPAVPEYTVAEGDSVSAIADRFGLRTDDILALNGLDSSSLIFPGQVLRLVPVEPTPPAAADPAPAPVAAPPAPIAGGHTVAAGDTVSAIASAAGLGVQALLDANGLTWSSIIYPGQHLVFPAAAVRAAAPEAPPVPVADVQPLPAADPDAVVPLTDEMRINATIIVQVGRSLGVPENGIVIALVAAAQESGMRNVDHGDADSLGLFQQRPSMGWGTPEQVMDPVRASDAFFGGSAGPNGNLTTGLLDISGWESMSIAQAAQAVQISAYPDGYAKWEASARAWLTEMG